MWRPARSLLCPLDSPAPLPTFDLVLWVWNTCFILIICTLVGEGSFYILPMFSSQPCLATREPRELSYTIWWKCKLVQLLWRTIWSSLETKNKVAMWSCNEPWWNCKSKRYTHPYVHGITIYISQDVEATSVPMDRWMDKEAVVHTDNGILLSHKKWNKVTDRNMDAIRDYHIKPSQKETDKCHMLSLISGI